MARILDNEKAETFGSLDSGIAILTLTVGTGVEGALTKVSCSFS
ncbi:hypothetical protein [Flavobacterium sp. ZS1P14]